jgi:methionyl-tRNA formyltransferase
MSHEIKFAFFGSSRFSEYVLDELKKADYFPILDITSAKDALPELPADLDLAIVASFGKILPNEYLKGPAQGFLNVHPSLLPELRGPSPIQNLILQDKEPGVTIIKMDEKMDHGPILAQEKVKIEPWPDHYDIVEEKLGRAGGKLVATLLSKVSKAELLTLLTGTEREQEHDKATYIKLIKKEDGLLNLEGDAETNRRKVLAYSTWPGAYFFFKRKTGEDLRVVVKDAKVEEGKFVPTRVIPAGKKEMDWESFLRGNR